jgi:hypothetical protein
VNTDYSVAQDIDICGDCLYYLANGTPESVDTVHCNDDFAPDSIEAIEAYLAAVEDSWKGWNVTIGSLTCEHCADDDKDCEAWFSHARCEMCNGRAGSRFHATVWPETFVALVGERDWTSKREYSADEIERMVMRQVNRLDSALREVKRERDKYEVLVDILDETVQDIATDLRSHVDNPTEWGERETLQDIARRLLQLRENDATRGADIDVPDVVPVLTELSPAQQAIYALTGRL